MLASCGMFSLDLERHCPIRFAEVKSILIFGDLCSVGIKYMQLFCGRLFCVIIEASPS